MRQSFPTFRFQEDPNELNDLANTLESEDIQKRLGNVLLNELYGSDGKWINGDQLVEESGKTLMPGSNRSLSATRGNRWPVPPSLTKLSLTFSTKRQKGLRQLIDIWAIVG